ncbi:MAG: hypothetical protein U5O15_02095 [Candidatus Krumholzibacteriota bacterium]|nr:hypothetical protein [Candidatus Krumholzibacteriota bacterium]
MARRVIIAFLLTIVIFFIARKISKNNSVHVELEKKGVRVEHSTVFEHVGMGNPAVKIKALSSESLSVNLAYVHGDNEEKILRMRKEDSGIWKADLPSLGKGEKLKYFFKLNRRGEEILRVPDDESFYTVKYKGEYSKTVVLLHIVFMFLSFFFIITSFLGSLAILFSGEGISYTIRMMRAGIICLFIGGWPLGFILNYQRFGPVWEGFPFGFDITDNKTQIIFVCWLIAALLVRGSFFGLGRDRDIIGKNNYAYAVIICSIITVGLYLIPHSL